MDRRHFLHLAAAGAAGGLAACSNSADGRTGTAAIAGGEVGGLTDLPEISWEMPTSWPVNLDTIYGATQVFADEVAALTGGRFTITPHPGGELVPALEVLQAVESGDYQIGHSTCQYYIDRAALTAFGTALPFGFTSRQQAAWLYEGGGLELLQRMYVDRFGVIQFPAGNTGAQMGGWFNRRIESTEDLAGLRMRIPGLGGRVLARLGVSVQQIPGGEIYDALQTGVIDAAEWVGPYDDLNLGFPEVADFYYYPGWWNPSATVEVQLNKREYDRLPEFYQRVIQAAAFKADMLMTARYDWLNAQALTPITADERVTILPFPDDVMVAAQETSFALFDELAAADADFETLLESSNAYRGPAIAWFSLAEASFLDFVARP